jgi:hypothetical protein
VAEHEPCIGQSDEWFTPVEIFDALKLVFDLDPCSPGPGHWVPARMIYTKVEDGLAQPWFGRVFVNPPYGGRFGHVPWLKKFLAHADGIGVFRAYTSSSWWHEEMPKAQMLLFPRGKTKFIRPDGSIGMSPGHGTVLIAMGDVCCEALKASNLGMIWDRRNEVTPIMGVNDQHKKLIDDTRAFLKSSKLFVQVSVPCFQPHQLAQVRHLVGDSGIYTGMTNRDDFRLVHFDFRNEVEAEAAIDRMQNAGFDDILIITEE